MYVPFAPRHRPARAARPHTGRPTRPALETLERRLALATFLVNSTGDQPAADPALGAETAAGTVTLRSAIQAANAHANTASGPDLVAFLIPGAGVQTVAVGAELPAVTDAVVIDGYTQPGARANSLNVGSDAVLLVGIDNPFGFTNGLTIEAGGSTVRGLIINRFSGNAVTLARHGGNTVAGNYLGLPAEGNVAVGNGVGVAVTAGSDGNLIGGTDPASRNVFAGSLVGVRIVASSGNVVQGNYFGLTPSGLGVLPNGHANVVVTSGTTGDLTGPATDNLIGGTVAGARNVLAAAGAGVVLGGDRARLTTGNRVVGNFIGTDANGAGTASFGHNGPGVLLDSGTGDTPDGASQNTIGGDTPEARNVIANNNDGVIVNAGATGNLIRGNYVGLNASGSAAPRRGTGGIIVRGDQTTVAGNAVGNQATGILVDGGNLTTVQGNLVGTDASGTAAVPNNTGVLLTGSYYATVGGTAPAERNVISGNSGQGVSLRGSGVGNHVLGNFIGTDVTGRLPLRNNADGVFIDFNEDGGTNRATVIGGPDPGAGNLIAFNGGHGVSVRNSTMKHETDGSIEGNTIVANTGNGVVLAVGTVATPRYRITRNSIASNGLLGIDLGDDGITPNDARGHDGPNDYENYPTITGVTGATGSTLVSGTLRDQPGTRRRLEFFANAAADPGGHGEGQTFLGFADVVTNDSGDAVFTDVVLPPLPAGQSFVTATATSLDGATSEFSQVFATTPTQPAADLAVAAGVSPAQSAPGGLLTYTLTVTNHGPAGAENVGLHTAVPSGSAFVSLAAPAGWAVTAPPAGASGDVSASLGRLNTGATAVFTFVVRVDANAPGGATLTAVGTVASDTPDAETANNTASASAALPPAPDHTDLAVTVVASPHSVRAGQTVTYTLTVTNHGAIQAGLNTMRMDVPAHTRFRSATVPGGWSATRPDVGGTGAVVATRGTIDVGSTAVFTVTLDVDPAAASGVAVTGLASVVSETPDANPADNAASDTATVTAAPPADLGVTIQSHPASAFVGREVVYTIALSNTGGKTATGVHAHVALPPNALLVQSGGGVVTAEGLDLTVGSLAAGTTWRMPITLRPLQTGTIRLTVRPAADPGALLGGPASVATPVIGDETNPPTVQGVSRYGYHTQPTLLVVTFSEAVDPALASNVGNYVVLVPAGRSTRVLPLSAAYYNPQTHQVTLRPAERIYLYRPWRLVVRSAIKDLAGHALAGGGVPGQDHVAVMDRRTLAGPASAAPGAVAAGFRPVPAPVPSGPRTPPIPAARPAPVQPILATRPRR